MRFVGDIHGDFDKFSKIIEETEDSILQVGDMGIGFAGIPYLEEFPRRVRFIRGNHDNPDLCRVHPNHLGDYNYFEDLSIMVVGGGYSIDKDYRVPFVSWWPEEELSPYSLDRVISMGEFYKPEIIVSHVLPSSVFARVTGRQSIPHWQGRTDHALSALLKIHRPKLWVCGHLHLSADVTIEGTRFKVLDCEEVFDVPGLEWK